MTNQVDVLKGEFPQSIEEYTHDKFGAIHTLVIKEDKMVVSYKILSQITSKQKGDKKSPFVSTRGYTLINESGLYSLIMHSRIKSTKTFQRWVTSEVLPSIRKYGAYITPEKLDTISNNPDEMKKLVDELTAARDKINNLESQVEQLTPLAEYTKDVLQSDEALPTTLVAKEYGMTAIAFHQFLKEMKIIFNRGTRWYPNRKYAKSSWFINQTYKYKNNSGKLKSSTNLYWTQLGRHEIEKVLTSKGVKRIA